MFYCHLVNNVDTIATPHDNAPTIASILAPLSDTRSLNREFTVPACHRIVYENISPCPLGRELSKEKSGVSWQNHGWNIKTNDGSIKRIKFVFFKHFRISNARSLLVQVHTQIFPIMITYRGGAGYFFLIGRTLNHIYLEFLKSVDFLQILRTQV